MASKGGGASRARWEGAEGGVGVGLALPFARARQKGGDGKPSPYK